MRRRLWARPPKGRRAGWRLALTVVLALFAAFAAYSYAETYHLEVEEYEYSGRDVPTELDGTRIVLLTDIHRGIYYSQRRLESLVTRVNALHPDLVLLGGDYVWGSRDYEAKAFAALADLEAPLGVYAVLGNHDYAHLDNGVVDSSFAVKAAADADIALLDNSGVWVTKAGERLRLVGVSDLREDFPNAAAGMGGATPNDLVVLLSHEPEYAEQLSPGSVDLVLAGHNHGGQITFFGLWTPLGGDYGAKYLTGSVLNGDTEVIVSNGIGTILVPFRFFAQPQIVSVTLRRAE